MFSLRRKERYARRKAMPNLYFLCHRHRLMLIPIAKNASTSLKALLYAEETGRPLEHAGAGHREWGWRENPPRTIAPSNTRALAPFRDYLRFVVYRDPVERFVSTYRNRVIGSRAMHPFYVGYRLEGMALDPFIDLASECLKIENAEHIDEHLRPQRRWFRDEDVDWIVALPDLGSFLDEHFGIKSLPSENQRVEVRVPVTGEQRERIRNLYREDYSIRPNYQKPERVGSREIRAVNANC